LRHFPEGIKMLRQPPVKVTFDTNTLSGVIDPAITVTVHSIYHHPDVTPSGAG
jgi:hypothetical protein